MSIKNHFLFIALFLFLSAGFVLQAEAFVGVSPGIVELNVRPEKKYKGTLTVKNPEQRKVTVTMEVQEWWRQKTGLPGLAPERWLTLKPGASFVLGPGKEKKVHYAVKLPSDYSGEVMAMIFFAIDRQRPLGQASVQLRHGIPIYAAVEGSMDIGLSVKGVAAHRVTYSSAAPLEFGVTLHNSGNVHLRPKGSVLVQKGGDIVEDVPLEWGWPVYPGREHTYNARAKMPVCQPGEYSAVVTVEYGHPWDKETAKQQKKIDFSVARETGFVEILP